MSYPNNSENLANETRSYALNYDPDYSNNNWVTVKSAIWQYGPIPRSIWSAKASKAKQKNLHRQKFGYKRALEDLKNISDLRHAITSLLALDMGVGRFHTLFLMYRPLYDQYSDGEITILSLDVKIAATNWLMERDIAEQYNLLQSTETLIGMEAIAGGLLQASMIKKWRRERLITLELRKLSQGNKFNSKWEVQQPNESETRSFTIRTEEPIKNHHLPEIIEPDRLYYEGIRDANSPHVDAIILTGNICGILQITRRKSHEIAARQMATLMRTFNSLPSVKFYYVIVVPEWRDGVEISNATEHAGNTNVNFHTAAASLSEGDLEQSE